MTLKLVLEMGGGQQSVTMLQYYNVRYYKPLYRAVRWSTKPSCLF